MRVYVVNFKQMVGLIILSAGMILMIYAFRSATSESSIAALCVNGTAVSGFILLTSGIVLSLYMNKTK
jgi:hypothetical protein